MDTKRVEQTPPTFRPGADVAASRLQAARNLAPSIRANADQIDATRELPRPVFEALADAGMFLLAVPRAIGGIEVDFPTYVQIIEEIGKADASTAWCVNQGAVFATYSARIPVEVARAIWIDTPRSVVANTPAPTAKAIPAPGGYRVTGRQGFSTGCRHASWIASQAQIVENAQASPKDDKTTSRYMFIPVKEVELLDTWHTRGMRGTGTHHFCVSDVFVPAERTIPYANSPLLHDGPLYKIPRTLCFASGDAAVALGVARSCLSEFYELAGAKAPRYQQLLLRDQPMTQFAVGRAEATLRSGRAFLMEAVAEIWEEATTKGQVSLDQRANLRIATTHAIRLSAEIVQSLYSAAGATAAFEGNLIQRHFQDIHVITQHVQSRLSHYELVGKHWLGLPVHDQHL